MKFEDSHQETENIEIACVDRQGNGKTYPLKDASAACRAEIFGRGTSQDFGNTLSKFPYEGQTPTLWDNLNTHFQQWFVSRALTTDKNYQSFQKETANALKGKLPPVGTSK